MGQAKRYERNKFDRYDQPKLKKSFACREFKPTEFKPCQAFVLTGF